MSLRVRDDRRANGRGWSGGVEDGCAARCRKRYSCTVPKSDDGDGGGSGIRYIHTFDTHVHAAEEGIPSRWAASGVVVCPVVRRVSPEFWLRFAAVAAVMPVENRDRDRQRPWGGAGGLGLGP